MHQCGGCAPPCPPNSHVRFRAALDHLLGGVTNLGAPEVGRNPSKWIASTSSYRTPGEQKGVGNSCRCWCSPVGNSSLWVTSGCRQSGWVLDLIDEKPTSNGEPVQDPCPIVGFSLKTPLNSLWVIIIFPSWFAIWQLDPVQFLRHTKNIPKYHIHLVMYL